MMNFFLYRIIIIIEREGKESYLRSLKDQQRGDELQ